MSRILLSMSLGDILSSIGWFLGAWMVPTEFDPNFYGDHARGSAATCRFQGFIFQLGVFASLLFNGSIAAVYLLMVRYKWTKQQLVKLFRPVVMVVWTLSLVSALALQLFDLYHPVGPICWINVPQLPEHCNNSNHEHSNTSTNSETVLNTATSPECQEHTINFAPVQVLMQLFPTWTCIILDSVAMFLFIEKLQRWNKPPYYRIRMGKTTTTTTTTTIVISSKPCVPIAPSLQNRACGTLQGFT